MPLSNGQILQSRYRILRLLGQGGMGAVYLAEDLRLPGRRCAVKENTFDPTASPLTLAQRRQQFQAEAQVLASLDHSNLPKVSDYFADGGNEFLVMDYVDGQNLLEALDQHLQQYGTPLPEKPVLVWADQVLDALVYLHGQRPAPIVHRDIKPGNLVLTPKHTVKLVDFGLVKLLDPANPHTVTAVKGLGTPAYTPLEQYSGAIHTDVRTDIYGLGATLYHLLTGVIPPDAPQRLADPNKLVPPHQLNSAITPQTEAALLRALAMEPADRFQTANEMRQALSGQTTAPASALTQPAHPMPSSSAASRSGGVRILLSVIILGAMLVTALLVSWATGLLDMLRPAPALTISPASTATPAYRPTYTPTSTASPSSTLTLTPSPTPSLTPTPTSTPMLTSTPTTTPLPSPTASVTSAPAVVAGLTTLQIQGNIPLNYWSVPSGEYAAYGVRFKVGVNAWATRSENASDFPEVLEVPVNMPDVRFVHFLYNGGGVYNEPRFVGKHAVDISFNFSDGTGQPLRLFVGDELRDWDCKDPSTVVCKAGNPAVRQAWPAPGTVSRNAVDMLSIEMRPEHRGKTLVSITFHDVSSMTMGSKDPAFVLISVTIQQ